MITIYYNRIMRWLIFGDSEGPLIRHLWRLWFSLIFLASAEATVVLYLVYGNWIINPVIHYDGLIMSFIMTLLPIAMFLTDIIFIRLFLALRHKISGR